MTNIKHSFGLPVCHSQAGTPSKEIQHTCSNIPSKQESDEKHIHQSACMSNKITFIQVRDEFMALKMIHCCKLGHGWIRNNGILQPEYRYNSNSQQNTGKQ